MSDRKEKVLERMDKTFRHYEERGATASSARFRAIAEEIARIDEQCQNGGRTDINILKRIEKFEKNNGLSTALDRVEELREQCAKEWYEIKKRFDQYDGMFEAEYKVRARGFAEIRERFDDIEKALSDCALIRDEMDSLRKIHEERLENTHHRFLANEVSLAEIRSRLAELMTNEESFAEEMDSLLKTFLKTFDDRLELQDKRIEAFVHSDAERAKADARCTVNRGVHELQYNPPTLSWKCRHCGSEWLDDEIKNSNLEQLREVGIVP